MENIGNRPYDFGHIARPVDMRGSIHNHIWIMAFGLALLVLSGCGILESEDRHLAKIFDSGYGPDVEVPDTVDVGEGFSFSFTVYTGACERFDGVEVERVGNRRDLRPMVRVERRETCLDVVGISPKTVELRFDAAGPADIVLHGLDESGEEVALTFELVVR